MLGRQLEGPIASAGLTLGQHPPASILLAIGRVAVDLAVQPEVEPVDGAFIDGEPLSRPPLLMIAIGEDIHLDRNVGMVECHEGIETEEIGRASCRERVCKYV